MNTLTHAAMGRLGVYAYKMYQGSGDDVWTDLSTLKAGSCSMAMLAPYVGGVLAVSYMPNQNSYLIAMAGGILAYMAVTKLMPSPV